MRKTHQVVVDCGGVAELTASIEETQGMHWGKPAPFNPTNPDLCKRLAGEGLEFGLWLNSHTHRSFLVGLLETLQEQVGRPRRPKGR